MVIVASLPSDAYYDKIRPDIVNFLKEMAEKTSGLDDFIVMLPRSLYEKYDKLPFGDDCLYIVIDEGLGFWMRDFGLVLPKVQQKFVYRPQVSFICFLTLYRVLLPYGNLLYFTLCNARLFYSV